MSGGAAGGKAKLAQKDIDWFNKANRNAYPTQAKLVLNAFWDRLEAKAEDVWGFYMKFVEIDLFLKGLSPVNTDSCGVDLDEHGFHVFLEKTLGPLTVLKARENLKAADVSFDGKVSFIEFLLWHLKLDAAEFIKLAPEDPDGDANITPEMRKAGAALAAAQAEVRKIEQEKERLQKEADTGSGIKAIRAKNELEQLLSRDPTDLNRALITAEAAVRKAGGSGVPPPPGSTWWMERELAELRKYKPGAKK